MTVYTDNSARFATTPEQRQRELVNEALNDFEAQLRTCRDLPGMYEFLERVAARLEGLGER